MNGAEPTTTPCHDDALVKIILDPYSDEGPRSFDVQRARIASALGDAAVEIDRMVAFRDHLWANEQDRRPYKSTKAALAERDWPSVQDDADAKTEVVADIMSRVDVRPPRTP